MDSEIIHDEGGTLLIGPDAIMLGRACAIRMGLKLWLKSKITIGHGISTQDLLKAATEHTNKKYGRTSDINVAAAIVDLNNWIATMEAALPTTDNRIKK